MVIGRAALDGHLANCGRPAGADQLLVPVLRPPATTTTPTATARIAQAWTVQGPHRPSPALAGRSGLCGQQVVVIGSGATAVTLIPAMADKVAHITMLQRSPTYVRVHSEPGSDGNWLRGAARQAGLPDHPLVNVRRHQFFYYVAQRRPRADAQVIRGTGAKALADGYDVDTHFNPHTTHGTSDCAWCPMAICSRRSEGKASVVTDQIDVHRNRHPAALRRALDADIIVTATGLKLKVAGGIEIIVDGARVDLRWRSSTGA